IESFSHPSSGVILGEDGSSVIGGSACVNAAAAAASWGAGNVAGAKMGESVPTSTRTRSGAGVLLSFTACFSPNSLPATKPSRFPSLRPSNFPFSNPSTSPSFKPCNFPAFRPSCFPSRKPAVRPSFSPASRPAA
ncbi:hypothetical protein B0H16DRAFT_1617234, partial [Mycena metata]